MNKTDLARFLALSSQPVGDVESTDPALFSSLQRVVADRARERLTSAFSGAPKELQRRISQLDLRGVKPAAMVDTVRTAVTGGVASSVAEMAAQLLAGLEQTGALADPFEQPDLPLRDVPAFRPIFEQARMLAVLDLAALAEPTQAKVQARAPSIDALDDDLLDRLVKAGELAQQDAARLGLGTAVFRLCDDSQALSAAALTTPAGPGKKAPASLSDLAAHDTASWRALLQRPGALPAGADLDARARALSRRFAALLPTEAFLRRLPVFDATRGREQIRALAAPSASSSGVPAASRAELGRLSRLYPGLALDAVIDDPALDPTTKADRVSRRIGLVAAIAARHPDLDLLMLDYAPDGKDLGKLDFSGIGATAEERGLVLSTLRTYQRVHRLTDDVDDAHQLLATGITSAVGAASMRLDQFQAVTGFDAATARRHHEKASEVLAAVTTGAATIHESARGDLAKLRVGDTTPDPKDVLAGLPGFAGMFGAISACRCEPCGSILGPVAYFVDLMSYVDAHVLKDFFPSPGHALDLRARRPDLWTLPLTCENTTTLIPTLQIVNEVLEDYLAGSAARKGDRAAIESAVYAGKLAAEQGSFRLPFVLPLARAEAYLRPLGVSRAEVARAVGATPLQVARAELGMGLVEHELITTRNLEHAYLSRLYGIPEDALNGGSAPVPTLMRTMGVTRAELGELLATGFVGGSMSLRASKKTADSVQNDVELVRDLDAAALDRMHRFTRLRRRLPWSIAELDLALESLGDRSLKSIEPIAAVRRAQAQLGTTVEETCALFAAHPRARQRTSGAAVIPRLLGGLRVADDDVRRLTAHVEAEPKSGLALVMAQDGPELGERHARLARHLTLTLPQLFQLIGFIDSIDGGIIDSIADLTAFLDAHHFWRAGDRSLDELGFILRKGVLAQGSSPDAAQVTRRVIAETDAPASLAFSDTLFAVRLGISEARSRAAVEALGTALVKDGDWYRVADGFDPNLPLTLPDALGISEVDVRALLRGYHAIDVLPRRLATVLSIPVEKVAALIDLTGRPLVGAGLTDALITDPSLPALPAAANPLTQLVEALLPLAVLFKAPAFDAGALRFIHANRPLLGLQAGRITVDLAAVQRLDVYARLLGSEARHAGDPEPINPGDLQRALALLSEGALAPANDRFFARLLGTTHAALASLREHLQWSSPVAVDRLERLASAASLTRTLGVDGAALAQIGADPRSPEEEAKRLSEGALALASGLRARYATEAECQAVMSPIEDDLRRLRRDALTDCLMCTHGALFPNRRAIYEYLLIDVDVEGCARTSRVVSATNSVQLYVQRCLMGLERDEAGTLRVEVGQGDARVTEQWEWRKAYRIWQANRKVFLYPENYIEPDLRDDKTPIFEELEAALLQNPIDEESVLDAYTAYTTAFDEVSKLTIAGSFYDSAADTLHLIGVSAGDPPTHYHRAVQAPFGATTFARQGTVFGPWRNMDTQIPARWASPVVHDGRLHVLWVELHTESISKLEKSDETPVMKFKGYRHKLALKLTTRRSDGTWSAPQRIALPKDWQDSGGGAGTVLDPIFVELDARAKWTIRTRLDPGHDQNESKEDYTLTGPNWETVIPSSEGAKLKVVLRNYRAVAEVDLFKRVAKRVGKISGQAPIATPDPNIALVFAKGDTSSEEAANDLEVAYCKHWYSSRDAFANMVVDRSRIQLFDGEYGSDNDGGIVDDLDAKPTLLAKLKAGTRLLAISGSPRHVILQVGADVLMLQRWSYPSWHYILRRLGTALGDTMARRLFEDGVEGLLRAQDEPIKEPGPPVRELTSKVLDRATRDLDFSGAYGDYYREVFFHIPFLIADSLNGQGEFAAAQRWYHQIFDPTAKAPWRYREFRDLPQEGLRSALTNHQAIARYEADPWNPYAIARLRPSAYQKSVVMKYLDNLLDWGDSLFTRFTRESVNEAVMLYTMAADILGERPVEVGSCGDVATSMTYAALAPSIDPASPFLIEVESYVAGKVAPKNASRASARYIPAPDALADALADADPRLEPAGAKRTPVSRSAARAPAAAPARAARAGDFALGVVIQIQMMPPSGPAFCVPANEDLLAYWDRVEDRLYKVHNCLDINGVRRDLALFAPEIDPRLLTQMKAEGLTLDEVMAVTSGDLPPYRFAYLIEKAKAFVGTLVQLGSTLLAALEKKDGEALSKLRVVHEQHLGQMNTQLRRWEIDAAGAALEQAERQRQAAEFRRDHYQALLDQGLNANEVVQFASRLLASDLTRSSGMFQSLASVSYLLPQLGSPFALKWGGKELGDSFSGYAGFFHSLSTMAEAHAASAGVEASFARRAEEWRLQRDLADREVKQLDRQVKAADIRRQIAERSLELHQKSTEQTEEVFTFLSDKLTGHGLYTWMAANLQRSYRQAFTSALALARLTASAFTFERDQDPGFVIGEGAWDAGRTGLLAGERLMLDLQTLERRYIETNYRLLEVEQSFALTQVDPAALVSLQETGECSFTIPEVLFDLVYPGHYRRRIKAVRVTIPSIAGPYANVGATLTLTGSKVRVHAKDDLRALPLQRTVSIATSRAQGDAGVFELSFHDERYMPFEGAGAAESAWTLSLPKAFPQFDYRAISDVILAVDYTALDDPGRRAAVAGQMAAAEKAIADVLASHSLVRVFSLRHDFPAAFTALVTRALATPADFVIHEWHFPTFVTGPGKTMTVTQVKVALQTAPGAAVGGAQLTLDGEVVEGLAADSTLGGLATKALAGAMVGALRGPHTIAVTAPGGLGGSGTTGLDEAKLVDVLIYVEYRVTV